MFHVKQLPLLALVVETGPSLQPGKVKIGLEFRDLLGSAGTGPMLPIGTGRPGQNLPQFHSKVAYTARPASNLGAVDNRVDWPTS